MWTHKEAEELLKAQCKVRLPGHVIPNEVVKHKLATCSYPLRETILTRLKTST